MAWDRISKYCARTYGVQVDNDDEFFICPECGEPIYKCDWRDSDYFLGHIYPLGKAVWHCPVCETVLYDEEEKN